MSALSFFALMAIVAAILIFIGSRAVKLVKFLLIAIGVILLLPSVYGLLTAFF